MALPSPVLTLFLLLLLSQNLAPALTLAVSHPRQPLSLRTAGTVCSAGAVQDACHPHGTPGHGLPHTQDPWDSRFCFQVVRDLARVSI